MLSRAQDTGVRWGRRQTRISWESTQSQKKSAKRLKGRSQAGFQKSKLDFESCIDLGVLGHVLELLLFLSSSKK